MVRRRLTALPDGNVPRAEHSSEAPAQSGLEAKAFGFGAAAAAPIARVAAEAAGAAALEEMAQALRTARETGRLVLDLPLDAIAPDHLTRDRLPVEDEEMAALRASIQAHGQRTPIEVTPLVRDRASGAELDRASGAASDRASGAALDRASGAALDRASGAAGLLPYGLISGWRRLAALKSLRAETGEARFATVQALVRQPETVADAYVSMVEENELRVGLSHYERARVAALSVRRGVFETEKAALLALFGTASRAKRSRIRAFLDIYHALDGSLRFPAHLPERLGLALVEKVRAGEAAGIAAAIAREDPQTPQAELATLTRALASPTTQRPSGGPESAPERILPGVTLRQAMHGDTLILKLEGEGVTREFARDVREMLLRLTPRR